VEAVVYLRLTAIIIFRSKKSAAAESAAAPFPGVFAA